MGKPIVYCGQCGKSLPEKEFERGRAQTIDNTPFCADCRPLKAVPERMPERPSSSKHPAMSKYLRRGGGGSGSGQPKWLLPAGIVLAAALLLALAAAMSGGTPSEAPSASTPAPRPLPPPPVPAAPSAPSTPAPVAPPPTPATLPPKAAAEVDREMKAQLEKESAAKFDRFLAQIREFVESGWKLAARKDEMENMFASAMKIAGDRKGEVEKLREEYDRKASLLGHWRLDGDPAAAVEDATGNGHDGDPVGVPQRGPGRIKDAFSFDGKTNGVTIQKVEGLSPQAESGELTVAAWVRVPALPTAEGQGRSPIVVKGDLRRWEYALYVHASGVFEFVVWMPDGTDHVMAAGGKAAVDRWHHLAGVYESGKSARLLVDGKEVGRSTTFKGRTEAAAGALTIGWRADGRQYLLGTVDDVRVYRKAVDGKGVQALIDAAKER